MPQSKKRKPHHHQQPPAAIPSARKNKKNSAVTVIIIFFALIGLAIAYFTAGTAPLWLVIGIVGGAIAGFLFGKQLDKSFSKK